MCSMFVKNPKAKIKTMVNNQPFLGVILIIFVHALINYIWLKKDNFPLWFDYGGYYQRSLELYYASRQSFADFISAFLGTGDYAHSYFPQRIIFPLLSLPVYSFFGVGPDTAVMSCTIFLTICLFSIYAITAKMFDRVTGFWAAFILSTNPGFFTYNRRYSLDFADTAMIAQAAYFL